MNSGDIPQKSKWSRQQWKWQLQGYSIVYSLHDSIVLVEQKEKEEHNKNTDVLRFVVSLGSVWLRGHGHFFLFIDHQFLKKKYALELGSSSISCFWFTSSCHGFVFGFKCCSGSQSSSVFQLPNRSSMCFCFLLRCGFYCEETMRFLWAFWNPMIVFL